jgi:antitoxin component YwqK of YwqJK toxin-antitoxin module
MSQDFTEKEGKYFLNGELLNGVYKDKTEEGSIISERNFRDGLEHGISIYYFKNANKKEQRTYNMGFKDGTWLTWNKNGIITAEANYTNDLKHGRWYINFDNGKKRYEMYYHKGKKVGLWLMWDENGKLISEKKFD